ncbi:MAG: outer membrane lipoprotein carrier protein LolA [Zoogloeaceae bacterium]|nr:outer membrane lipoprotein carrier protein LolA [Zoogloeaceae bacterium]
MKKSCLASFALFLFLLFTLPARGDVLREIESRLVLAPVTRGDFVQTRQLVNIKKPLVSKGHFLVAREAGVLWENRTPFPQTTRLTRAEIVQTDANGKPLMRLSADREPAIKLINSILFAVLSGDLSTLAQYFAAEGEVKGTGWKARFTPRDASLARILKSLTLTGASAVTQVEMENATGDFTRIVFQNQHHAQSLTDTEKRQFSAP